MTLAAAAAIGMVTTTTTMMIEVVVSSSSSPWNVVGRKNNENGFARAFGGAGGK